ncbi:MAG: hypothetical protein GC151_09175 [Betaproteobacteria bacterium]|nr:hypothetical protein [Betaproteobacteria bacterium]
MKTFVPRAVLAIAFAVAGCAHESYRPRPLDAEASAAALETRTLSSDALRDYLAAQGQSVDPWPRGTWDLPALTRAAVFYHPDVELARARARVAAAETRTSKTRLPFTVTARPEYNGKAASGATPWGLGLLVGLPIDIGHKRAAQTEHLARLESAADIDVAVASWRVRSRLRQHFVDLFVARQTAHAVDGQRAAQQVLLALLERREKSGYASATEVARERLKADELEVALGRANLQQDQALAAVAEAVGLPVAALRGVTLDFSVLEHERPEPAADEIRRLALRNRIDLQRKLADYAAAEAAVKLEVARQYPDITLVPGYFWDADQSLWSIAFLGLVPQRARSQALIAEAEARREVEEKAFLALQARVIAEAEAAASRYAHAVRVSRAARRQIDAARGHVRQVEAQFERGWADRLDLARARLEAATAERSAVVATLELQRGMSAVEDALQRPLDGPALASTGAARAATSDTAVNPALIDND